MPNGGADCCGTCWFNRKNKGEIGYAHANDLGDDLCLIRGLTIPNSFWTYCANHPCHNPQKVELPVGPVCICKTGSYDREIWVDCADNETIRVGLVHLLEQLPEIPWSEYPSGTRFDEELIHQLGVFRERRAAKGLRRILSFDPDRYAVVAHALQGNGQLIRDRRSTIGHALEALSMILGDNALPDIKEHIFYGLDANSEDAEAAPIVRYYGVKGLAQFSSAAKANAIVRYYAVKSIGYCCSKEAMLLLQSATADPNPNVASLAQEIMNRRRCQT